MNETKVDWSLAPEDAEFYSAFCFRKYIDGVEYAYEYDKWTKVVDPSEPIHIHERDYHDFEERPPQYDQSQDGKWDNGELGRDEQHVRVAPLIEKEFNQVTAKTSIDFLNIVKDIQEERGAEYEQKGGERSFAKIAEVFNIYRGKDLLPSDIALILEIMKNVRFYAQDRYHLDSVIDKVSYASLWAELVTQERA